MYFVPQQRQRHVLAPELAMHSRPIRLDLAAMTLLGASRGEEPFFKRRISHLIGQRPSQPGDLKTLDRRAYRRGGHADTAGNLADRHIAHVLQTQNIAHLAHRRSLCRHPFPPSAIRRREP
jgi:hypothetical protein